MLDKKKISIFAYSNKRIGSGHVKRSKVLHEYLKQFYNCNLYVNRTITKNKVNNINAIIIDDHHKKIEKELIKGVFSIGLDYYGTSQIDKNILVIKHKKIFTKNNNIDLQNIILDKKRLDLKKKKLKEKKNTLLISLGSTNKKNLISKILARIKKKEFKITVIKGRFNFEKIKVKDKDIRFFDFRSDFYDLLRKHEFIITNTATTFFESAYLKKKILSIPQTKFENNLYKKIFKKNFNNAILKKNIITSSNFKKLKIMKFDGEKKIKSFLNGI